MKYQSAVSARFSLYLLIFLAFASGGAFCASRNTSVSSLLTGPSTAISKADAYSDELIIASTKSVLKSMNVDVLKIEIVKDRSYSGERILIINCVHCSGSEEDRVRELVKVMQSGHAVNKIFQARIDAVTTVIGNRQGQVAAIITARCRDAELYMETRDVFGYLNRWTVAIFEPDFLAQTAAIMDW